MMQENNVKEINEFKNEKDRHLFSKITKELRCSVCQNQNLADSMSGMAIDLRNEIYVQVLAGKNESSILEFVRSHYGDSLLYCPPLKTNTYILWFGPLIMLLLTLIYFIRLLRK